MSDDSLIARSRRRPTRSTPRSGDRHRQFSAIHRAIDLRDAQLITKLLNEGETLCTGEGVNCFILAALLPGATAASRWKILQQLLEADSKGVSARDEDGNTLLMLFSDDPEKVKYLLQKGANVHDVNKKSESVLQKSFQSSSANLEAFTEILKPWEKWDKLDAIALQLLANFKYINNKSAAKKIISAQIILCLVTSISYLKNDGGCANFEKDSAMGRIFMYPLLELRRHSDYNIIIPGMVSICNFQRPLVYQSFSTLSFQKIQQRHGELLKKVALQTNINLMEHADLDLCGLYLMQCNLKIGFQEATICDTFQKIVDLGYLSPSLNRVLHPITAFICNVLENYFDAYEESALQHRGFGGAQNHANKIFSVAYACYKIVRVENQKRGYDAMSTVQAHTLLTLIQPLLLKYGPDLHLLLFDVLRCSPQHPYIYIGDWMAQTLALLHNARVHANYYDAVDLFLTNFLDPLCIKCEPLEIIGMPGSSDAVKNWNEYLHEYPDLKYFHDHRPFKTAKISSLTSLSRFVLRQAISDEILRKQLNTTLPKFIEALVSNKYLPNILMKYVLVYPDLVADINARAYAFSGCLGCHGAANDESDETP